MEMESLTLEDQSIGTLLDNLQGGQTRVDTKRKTKESKLLELKRDFEEFVKTGASKEGLIIDRILFDINPAIEIIKDIEENNLYKIELFLDFYIPDGAKANFKTIFNFRKNELTKNSEVILFKHNFEFPSA
jgi:hypothetical protein